MLIYFYIFLIKNSILDHEDGLVLKIDGLVSKHDESDKQDIDKVRTLNSILECKRKLERVSVPKDNEKKDEITEGDNCIKFNLQDLIKYDEKKINLTKQFEVETYENNFVDVQESLKDSEKGFNNENFNEQKQICDYIDECEIFLADASTNASDLFDIFYKMPEEIFQEYRDIIVENIRQFKKSVYYAVAELDICKMRNNLSTKKLKESIKKVKNNFDELRILAQDIVSEELSPYDDKFLLERSVRLLEFFDALVFIEYHTIKKIGDVAELISEYYNDIFRYDIEGYFIDQDDVKVSEYWQDVKSFVSMIENIPILTEEKEIDDPLEELSYYFEIISKMNLYTENDILNPQIFKNILKSNIFGILDEEIKNIDNSSIEEYSKELVMMLKEMLDNYIKKLV